MSSQSFSQAILDSVSGISSIFRHAAPDRAMGDEFLHKRPGHHESDSWKYRDAGQAFHRADGTPVCPACGDPDVIEQGYEYNHRHHCNRCRVTYWIQKT